jgi:hypothetical protein
MGCSEGFLVSSKVAEVYAEIILGCSEIGEEGVGLGGGKSPANFDSLSDCVECLFSSSECSKVCAKVVQCGSEVGAEGVESRGDKASSNFDGLSGSVKGFAPSPERV